MTEAQRKEIKRQYLHQQLDRFISLGMDVAIIARYPKGGWGYAYSGDRRGLYGTIRKIYKYGFTTGQKKQNRPSGTEG